MGYYRRRARPSQYRYLSELKPTLLAALAAFIFSQASNMVCAVAALGQVQEQCGLPIPGYVWLAIAAIGVYGIVASAYRYYRDFYMGEYWEDFID